MTQAVVYTQDGKKGGSVDLPDSLFALPWTESLVHQIVVGIAANQRAGTAHTKGRSAVRGGGRKPWRQKGTGRARHGSRRSPLWVGGGVTFGPDVSKQYRVSFNKKALVKAFFVVLSDKLRHDALAFVEPFSLESPSTKTAVSYIEKLCGEYADKKKNVCTIVFAEKDEAARKSLANIKGVSVIALDVFNVRDALSAKKVFFVDPQKVLPQLVSRGARLSGGSTT